MSMIDNLFIKLFSTRVGADRRGNQYYLSSSRDYRGKRIRQVIYQGLDEPTQILTEWYSWIHYLSDDLPEKETCKAIWHKERIANRTGSKDAYSPNHSGLKQEYTAWQSNKN